MPESVAGFKVHTRVHVNMRWIKMQYSNLFCTHLARKCVRGSAVSGR